MHKSKPALYSGSFIKLVLLFALCIAQFTKAFSQKEYNTWYFGSGAGITFNTVPPSALTNSTMRAVEGAGSICDNAGNLLFYTDADTVFNRLHKPMKSGIFTPYTFRESSKQAAMVLPYPGQPGKYYIITSSSLEGTNKDDHLRYSVVDMTKDGGLGEVITPNVPLVKGCYENFAAARHANGSDYWLASICNNDSFLYTVRTVNGTMGVAQKGPQVMLPGYLLYNTIKFSPNSAIIKLADNYNVVGINATYYYNLYRFDNNTGSISNPIKIEIPDYKSGFGPIEFSADSRFLYTEEVTSKAPHYVQLVQYDLSVWHSDSVSMSRVVLDSVPRGSNVAMYGIQLGPDGKIYVFRQYSRKLFVINYPEKKGKACGYDAINGIDLKGRTCYVGSPYYPTFWFQKPYVQLPPDTVLCQGDSFTIKPVITSPAMLWSTGEITPTITVTKSGVYWVKSVVNKDTAVDSIKVDFKKPFVVYLGSDTAFCGKFAHLLDAGKGAKKYLWNTGDTTITKLVEKPGMYAVTIKDSSTCQSGDTINIGQLNPPPVKISYDSVTCSYVTLSAPPQSEIKYLWSTGDTSASIKITKKGIYKLTASNVFCSISTTINVSRLAMPEIDLGQDTSLCSMPALLLQPGDSGSYKWSTGVISPTLLATDGGWYSVTVSRNNCTASDSIYISDDCGFWYFIPNAFTPNGDGMNNVFGITGEITSAKMLVFDRWGEKIFDGQGQNPAWDGTYKGLPCPAGAYVYAIEIKGKKHGRLIKENVTGNVTLLR